MPSDLATPTQSGPTVRVFEEVRMSGMRVESQCSTHAPYRSTPFSKKIRRCWGVDVRIISRGRISNLAAKEGVTEPRSWMSRAVENSPSISGMRGIGEIRALVVGEKELLSPRDRELESAARQKRPRS